MSAPARKQHPPMKAEALVELARQVIKADEQVEPALLELGIDVRVSADLWLKLANLARQGVPHV